MNSLIIVGVIKTYALPVSLLPLWCNVVVSPWGMPWQSGWFACNSYGWSLLSCKELVLWRAIQRATFQEQHVLLQNGWQCATCCSSTFGNSAPISHPNFSVICYPRFHCMVVAFGVALCLLLLYNIGSPIALKTVSAFLFGTNLSPRMNPWHDTLAASYLDGTNNTEEAKEEKKGYRVAMATEDCNIARRHNSVCIVWIVFRFVHCLTFVFVIA